MLMKDKIKPGIKLQMRDNNAVCNCSICRMFADEIVTFREWKESIDDRGVSFSIEEEGQTGKGHTLFLQNIEKIVYDVDIPEELFEIE